MGGFPRIGDRGYEPFQYVRGGLPNLGSPGMTAPSPGTPVGMMGGRVASLDAEEEG